MAKKFKKAKKSQNPRGGAARVSSQPGGQLIYGIHAVSAALSNPARTCRMLYATASALSSLESNLKIRGVAIPKGCDIQQIEVAGFKALLPEEAVHQGVALEADPLDLVFFEEWISPSAAGPVVMLDQVTDPRNVGAILRSAAAFGAAAVIVQKKHSPPMGNVLAKTASGAVDLVPLVQATNLARALEELQELGFLTAGLDERGEDCLGNLGVRHEKICLVMGAEGRGLRPLVAKTCDQLIRLPTQEQMPSLNVSNAAAVALYAVTK